MTLARALSQMPDAVRLRLVRVRGSCPREEGAEMVVGAAALHGTIGGGQLEYMAIDRARAMLRDGEKRARMDVPLGPEIGQCCGGRVEIALERLDDAARAAMLADAEAEARARPHLYIFGAGHVGRALAQIAQTLPLRVVLVDSRAGELAQCTAQVETRLSVLPEALVRAAPPGSAFVVLTHDHALDFLLAAEALARDDAAYAGMIGSATKRAKFARYLRTQWPDRSVDRLVCPMGAHADDKRPEVIAAFVAAEALAAVLGHAAAARSGAKARVEEHAKNHVMT
ncbi:xanthine dehydrogenase accessory protein XdhC (plasmid) [Limimaricola variabilis]|uniref:xanthine dehydrogenase accessory protein XdhC n=1 Tax=Limimaricola variabilis TaxID=1492771 RepID=UPI002AC923BA|nr:xanthine dehydrogenase accessory protein XdhC [Limimaricola variabilis]WPY96631.1 xanthine dehydrogenase accessory protein XdhC [Limimaricola variabilis]